MLSTKEQAAALSIISNTILILLKLSVGLAIGSVSVISEAIHSGIDLLAAVIALFSVHIADRPADVSHPYGHGKVENVSGTIEAGLIFLAAIFIIYESVRRITHGLEIESVNLGLAVMLVSIIVNLLVSRHLRRVAMATDSLALEADAWHLRTDIYTALGVLLGLFVVGISGWKILDPLIAIAVALFITKAAIQITKKSFVDLLDARLPGAEQERIAAIINDHYRRFVEFHDLRTRKAGSIHYVDLHLVVNPSLSVEQAHELCDHLEQDLEAAIPNCSVTIHVEPSAAD
ncbi:MAG: cation diffusion facilitator family transporter [Chloroflexi bacterium]|nr:cation diffusion facilitator family transporter [Chloroflexota bacterium]MCL5076046.1 cation diffusion facilitator family transporter [Chloroflexota bacterium]